MHSVRLFRDLDRVASRRALILRTLVHDYPTAGGSKDDRVVSYVAIEALNLWASFVRSFYLSCVVGVKNRAGQKITISRPGVSTASDAIIFSIRRMKPWVNTAQKLYRRDEPTWHDPNTIITLLTALGSSNLSQVHAAFAYPTFVFKHLPTFRNFFAHRNEDTAKKTAQISRSYGMSARLRPSEFLCTKVRRRPQNVLSDWLDDIRNVIGLLCQ